MGPWAPPKGIGSKHGHLTDSRTMQCTRKVHWTTRRGFSNDVILGCFIPGASVSLQQLTRMTQHVQFVLVAAAEQNTIIRDMKCVKAVTFS